MLALRSLLASWIALACVCTAAAAAERHPFSVEDLVRLQRGSEAPCRQGIAEGRRRDVHVDAARELRLRGAVAVAPGAPAVAG